MRGQNASALEHNAMQCLIDKLIKMCSRATVANNRLNNVNNGNMCVCVLRRWWHWMEEMKNEKRAKRARAEFSADWTNAHRDRVGAASRIRERHETKYKCNNFPFVLSMSWLSMNERCRNGKSIKLLNWKCSTPHGWNEWMNEWASECE